MGHICLVLITGVLWLSMPYFLISKMSGHQYVEALMSIYVWAIYKYLRHIKGIYLEREVQVALFETWVRKLNTDQQKQQECVSNLWPLWLHRAELKTLIIGDNWMAACIAMGDCRMWWDPSISSPMCSRNWGTGEAMSF